jgi:PAS domain S-box-containing protein
MIIEVRAKDSRGATMESEQDITLRITAIQTVPHPLLVLERSLRIEMANDAFLRVFQLSRGQTIGRLIYELADGEWDIPQLHHALEDLLPRQQSLENYETAHTFKSIGTRVIVLNGSYFKNGDYILLAIDDVSSRLHKAKLKDVAETAHVGVLEADLQCGNLYWSPEFRSMVGVPDGEPPSAPGVVPDFVHPADKRAVQEMFGALLDPRSEGSVMHEHRIVRPDGEIRWVRIHGQTEFEEERGSRRPTRMRGIVLDVTQTKNTEEALRKSEERQNFLLRVADVLRTEESTSTIKETVSHLLAEKLMVDRIFFYVFDGDKCLIEGDFSYDGRSLTGRHPLNCLKGSPFCSQIKKDDVFKDDVFVVRKAAQTEPSIEQGRFADIEVAAIIEIPLHRDGNFIGGLAVLSSVPRDWSVEEIDLAKDVAERTWTTIERIRVTEMLRESDARFRRIAEANLIGVGFGTSRGNVTYLNDEMLRMMGRTRAEFEAEQIGWMETLAPEHRKEAADTIAELNLSGAVSGLAWSFLKPDGERTHFIGAGALTSPAGDNHVSLAVDITDRVRAEERTAMLMAELDHRVKNIFAVVQAITWQTLGRGKTVGPEAADLLVGRLKAFAQSHALLASSSWDGARFGDIVETTVAAYRGDGAPRVILEGPDLRITPKAAQSLNLAIHELVTNAAKYGALSREGGYVTADWRLAGDDSDRRLVFTWAEHDGPPIEEPPMRKGFGSKLIESTLKFQLEGRVSLDYARKGLRATIELPIEGLRCP